MNRIKGNSGRRHSGGFTLIEVLVTIAVLMIMMPIIVQGFTIAADLARLTRQRAEATAIAQSKLDEFIATGTWQQGGSGEEINRATVYTWVIQPDAWDEADAQSLLNVQRLDITVTWSFRSNESPQQVQLTTVVYVPDTTTQTTGSTTGGTLP